MPAKVTHTGLREELAAIESLADDCQGEAMHIVEGAANGAAVDVRTAYGAHVFSGKLQERVLVEDIPNGKVVKSGSPLAYIFEFGSEARHYVTKRGITHEVGAMPAAHIFVTIMVRTKRRMQRDIISMIWRHGATHVSGGPDV